MAFEQKFVANKILADVILNREFVRERRDTGNGGTGTCPGVLSIACHKKIFDYEENV
jgi:hypothetical protein